MEKSKLDQYSDQIASEMKGAFEALDGLPGEEMLDISVELVHIGEEWQSANSLTRLVAVRTKIRAVRSRIDELLKVY